MKETARAHSDHMMSRLGLRLSADDKKALQEQARKESRSISNMARIFLLNGLKTATQSDLQTFTTDSTKS